MRKLPCLLLVPMRFGNSQKPVSSADFNLIQRVLNKQFGGHTPIGSTAAPPGIKPGGQWIDPDTNETVHDECWQIKVAVDEDKADLFRTVVHRIGVFLEQKAMYLEIGPPSVEILTVFDGESPAPPKKTKGYRKLLFDDLLNDISDDDTQNGPIATGSAG